MTILKDEYFSIFQIIRKISHELEARVIEFTRVKSQENIKKILSEPSIGLYWFKSELEAMIETSEQETISQPPKTVTSVSKNKKSSADKEEKESIATDHIAKALKKIDSREAGRIFLKESCRTKKQLEILAKFLEIPIGRLKKEQLLEKIVQDTIGHRIDSKVIQEHKWDKRDK